MRKISSLWYAGVAVLAMPALALAQATPGAGVGSCAPNTLCASLLRIEGIFNLLIVLMITLGVVVFFWGLVSYLTRVGEAKHEGLIIMFYGIITLVVMVSVWGLVNVIANTFGLNKTTASQIPMPKVPTSITYQNGI